MEADLVQDAEASVDDAALNAKVRPPCIHTSLGWQHCRIRKRLSSSAAEGGAPAWWVELELADNPESTTFSQPSRCF